MMHKNTTSFIFGLMLIQPCFAAPQTHLNGFLSAGAAVMDVEPVLAQTLNPALTRIRAASGLSPAYYPYESMHPEMNDFNSKPNFQEDSIVALQAAVDFTPQYGMTVQVTAAGADEWKPNVEWAFLSYRVNDHWRLRAGRLRLGQFMLSESVDVGYTYPWVRPPLEVYSVATSSNFTGADVTYRNVFWHQDFDITMNYSSADAPYVSPLGAAMTNFGQMARQRQELGWTANFGNEQFKVRGSYNENAYTLTPAGQVTQLSNLYAALYNPDAAADGDVTNVKVFFASVGANIDYKNVVVMGEWVKRGSALAAVSTQKAYYGTVGYRFGNWLPHFTYANLKTTDKSRRVYSGTYGTYMNPIAALFNQDQATYILGLRYDVMAGVDIKVQAESVRALHNTAGLFNVNPNRHATLYSAVIDLVF